MTNNVSSDQIQQRCVRMCARAVCGSGENIKIKKIKNCHIFRQTSHANEADSPDQSKEKGSRVVQQIKNMLHTVNERICAEGDI